MGRAAERQAVEVHAQLVTQPLRVFVAPAGQGQALRMTEIPDIIVDVDIIIGSTGSPQVVITKDQVKAVLRKRKNRPLFFIDIAVPRDIDPEINRLTNTYVYDIDDLKSVIEENIEDRNREAQKAERMIDEAVIRFREWYIGLDVVPTLVGLRSKVEQIAAGELERTLQSGRFSEEETQQISRMVHTMVNKILHEPTVTLKRSGCRGDKALYIDITRKLFHLDEEDID